MKKLKKHPLWAQELYNFKDHTPETEEYGIGSFVYKARAPFDPKKIHDFFNKQWSGIIRAKGFFWIASRPDFVAEVSQAGAFVRHQKIGKWLAAVPEHQRPQGEEFDQTIKEYWNEDYGDRRQQIVFIGLKNEINESDIRKQLDECLAKDWVKNHSQIWGNISDPFPEWF